MAKRNNSDLFFLCSLIEQLGRDLKLARGAVVTALGLDRLRVLYDHADVLHCEPIQKVADDVAAVFSLPRGSYNNLSKARYRIPDVWTMGKVYARLIEDVAEDDTLLETLVEVYTSWVDEALCNYNSSFYYEPREYIAECYREGEMIDD